MPRVSIVVPAYNSQAYISQALQSIRGQTFTDWEILVIDDGSTDLTLQTAKASNVPFRYFSQAHRGPGAARNMGIKESLGEWVAFLDADDVWLPTKLADQFQAVDQCSGVGAVYCDAYLKENDKVLERKSDQVQLPSGDIALQVLLDPRIICTSTLLFRKALWSKVGMFDESSPISEDWEWFVRLACHTPIIDVSEPLVNYRLHAGNTHRNLDLNLPHARRMLKKAIFSFESIKGKLPAELRRRLWHTFFQTYGIAYLFAWRPAKALPFFVRAMLCSPTNLRNYGYISASVLPSGVLQALQRRRGRPVEKA